MDRLPPELNLLVDSFIPFHEFHKEKYKSVLKSIVTRGSKFCRGCTQESRIHVLPTTKVYYIFETFHEDERYKIAECLCKEHYEENENNYINKYELFPNGMEKRSIEILEFLAVSSPNVKCIFPQIHGYWCRTDEYISSLEVEDGVWSDYSFFQPGSASDSDSDSDSD